MVVLNEKIWSEESWHLFNKVLWLSTITNVLLKPNKGTFTEDLKHNWRTYSPLLGASKAISLGLWVLGLRLAKVTNTRLALWLGLTMLFHWQDQETHQAKQMDYSLALKIFRRVLFAYITLPSFVIMVICVDFYWVHLLLMSLLYDCLHTEVLACFSPPAPGKIYLRREWPYEMLLGTRSGVVEINTRLDLLEVIERKIPSCEKSNSKMDLETPDENSEDTPDTQHRDNKFESVQCRSFCERVRNVSEVLFGSATEKSPDTELDRNIFLLSDYLISAQPDWACRHWNCLGHTIVHSVCFQVFRVKHVIPILVLWSLFASSSN